MSDVIVISVDLDQKALESSFAKIEKTSEEKGLEVGQKTGDSIVSGLDSSTQKFNLSEKLNSALDNARLDRIKDRISSAFSFADIGLSLGAAGGILSPIIKDLGGFKELVQSVSKVTFNSKNLLGIAAVASITSAALSKLSSVLGDSESNFISFGSSLIKVAAILAGGVATGIGFLILKLSDLAFSASTNVVNSLREAAEQFIKLNSEARVLASTIENFNRVTDGGVGSISSYQNLITGLSSRLNILETDLNKAAREIIQVGSQAGLGEKQLRQLLVTSAEYAKINSKDVFQTSVAITGALLGNSQAVTSLGIKLNETSVQAFAFKKGLTENFRTLSDGQKVQLRYNKLLEQFNQVVGIADTRANTLGDAQNRLAANVERLNASFGAGASIILRNNLLYFLAGKAVSFFSESTLFAAGFLGALFGRITQGLSILIKFTFTIFAVTKAIKALDIALKSTFATNLFKQNIPIIQKSLNGLLTSASGTTVSVRNLNTLILGLSSSLKGLLGTGGKGIGLFRSLTSGVSGILLTLKPLLAVLASLAAPFIIIALKIAAVVALLAAFKKAFEVIEERTGFFSESLSILNDILSQTSTILGPVISLFVAFGRTIQAIAFKAFGFFVQKVAQVLSLLTSLAAKNPFGVFSEKTVQSLKNLESNLDGFTEKIKLADFDLRNLAETSRNLAGQVSKPIKPEVNLEALTNLRNEFRNFGESDLQVLRDQLNQRLTLIKNAEQQGLIGSLEAANIRRGLLRNFENEQTEILAGQAFSFSSFSEQVNAGLISIAKQATITGKTVASALVNGIGRGAGNAFAAFGAAIVSGENALEAFGKALLAAFGQSLVQLGTGFILQGVAQSLAGFGSGLPLIAAGAALATFGGVLSGVASGGAPSTQAGVGTGGSSAGIGTSPELPSLADSEPEEPNTQVQVIVQGSIFDSEETGNRIASVLQKAALNNNVRIFGGIA